MVAAAIAGALVLIPLAMTSLPARVKVRGRIVPGKTDLDFGLRVPLLPWYLPWSVSRDSEGVSMGFPGKLKRSRPRAGADRKVSKDPGDGIEKHPPRRRRGPLSQVKRVVRALPRVRRKMMQAVDVVAGAVEVEEAFIRGWVGLGDALSTALATGSFVALLTAFLRFAQDRGVSFDKGPEVAISPSYTEKGFSFGFGVTMRSSALKATRTMFALRRLFQDERGGMFGLRGLGVSRH